VGEVVSLLRNLTYGYSPGREEARRLAGFFLDMPIRAEWVSAGLDLA
jgi:hypothetical protein